MHVLSCFVKLKSVLFILLCVLNQTGDMEAVNTSGYKGGGDQESPRLPTLYFQYKNLTLIDTCNDQSTHIHLQ